MVTVRKPMHRQEQKDKTGLDTGPGLTEQAHKDETDMNLILEKYARTGYIRHAKKHQGKYDDISVQDFQSAMFIVSNAQSMFNELPALVRKEFGNEPSRFLDFVQNPANEGRMRELGILRGNDGLDISGAAVGSPRATPPAPPPAEEPVPPAEGG